MRTLSIIAAAGLLTSSGLAYAADTSSTTSGWQLHGFGDMSFKNDYITPRGLVVTTRGETAQILDGLVFVSPGGIAFTVGTWTDLNPGYSKRDGNISTVNEVDVFAGVSGTVENRWKWGVQYVQFISGQTSVAFKDERNIEFSLAYDDKMSKNFSINPYAKLFWAFNSKSSTVVTGKAGHTFDVELGAVPTLTAGALTFSVPTWVTVGPKSYWAGPGLKSDGNVGTFSTGLKVSTPVHFANGAHMNVYLQAQLNHIINDNLLLAKEILNSGDHKRDNVVFGGGVGFGF